MKGAFHERDFKYWRDTFVGLDVAISLESQEIILPGPNRATFYLLENS